MTQQTQLRPISDLLAEARALAYRGRWIGGGITGVGLLAGVALALLSEPSFRSTATILVDQQSARVLGTEDADPSAAIQDADRFLQTQVETLKGRSMTERVVSSLKLRANPQSMRILQIPQKSDPAQQLDEVYRAVERKLSVDLPVDSRLIRVSVVSSDSALSAQIANAYADSFVGSNLSRKQGVTGQAQTALNQQLADAQLKLEASERAVVDYARRNQIVSVPVPGAADGTKRSIIDARLSVLNDSYSAATARRIDAEQRWGSVGGSSVAGASEALSNPAYQELIKQRVLARAHYQDETARRKEDYPTVRQAAARLAEIERQLADFGGHVRSSVRMDYRSAAAQEQAIAREIGRLKGASLAEQSKSVQMIVLEREAEKARSLYDALLQRLNEINAQAQGQLNNAVVLDRGSPSFRPAAPGRMLYVPLGLLAGLMAAVLVLLMRETLSARIRTPADAEKLGLPVLGTLPLLKRGQGALQDLLSSNSRLADSALSLAAALGITRARTSTSVAISSADAGEGKTSLALALAVSLARSGKRTLLVDLDLRDPGVMVALGLPPAEVSITELFDGTSNLSAIVRTGPVEHLSIAPAGPASDRAGELLASVDLPHVIASLKQDYEIVIIDCPPVLELADAKLIGAASDMMVFVAAAGKTEQSRAIASIARLIQAGAKPKGVALSHFDAQAQGYQQRYGQPIYGCRLGEAS